MRVLVAEDDRAQQRLLEATLGRWGYDVVSAKDGLEAWDLLKSADDTPQLALLDWVMPGMDGPDVCHAVRELHREPYVYIVLLTSRDRTQDVVTGMEAGADDYLTKPWHPQELSVRLRAGRRILGLQQELIEARDALRESEERYRILFDMVPVGLGLTGLGGHVYAANTHLCGLLGYTLDELQQIRAGGTYPDPGERECVLAALAEAGELHDYEVTLAHKNGAGIEASLSLRSTVLAGEDVLLSAIQDISKRKQTETAMREAARLEIAARLAGGTAHIINNRMMAVITYAQTLRDEVESRSQAHRMLSVISEEAQQASDLAYRLLAFARSGKWETQAVNLNDVVREHVEVPEPPTPERIKLTLDLDPDLWTVEADPMQMAQVVACLHQNAVEAMEEEGHMTVTTRNAHSDQLSAEQHAELARGTYVMLSVKDTGCGMDEHTLARIFEPFFTTKFLGRGMGLAAVQGIVLDHGGHISVRSDVGTGSTFEVHLPACTQ